MSEPKIDHSQDPRVQAIRSQSAFQLTNVDECMTDEEVVGYLNDEGIKSPKKAVEWAFDEALEWADRMADFEAGGSPEMGQRLIEELEAARKKYRKSLRS